MKRSLRAKRMDSHHRRLHRQSALNLTSLMDIFTILVFFLMVNSGDVQVLQKSDAIKLPESVAKQQPQDSLTIMITGDDVLVQGRKIVDVKTVLRRDDESIRELNDELVFQASKRPELSEEEKQVGRAVIIMGDQALHYKLLKRVMATCAKADYRNISLAVSKIEGAAPVVNGSGT
jgi:biopolymer transport protein TolR